MLNIHLGFDSPWYLALAGLLPLLWWFSYRSLAALGAMRRGLAIAARSLVLLLIICALAEVQWKRISDRLTVIFVVDKSFSVPSGLDRWEADWVNQEIATHRSLSPKDRAGAILFGGDAAIEHPPYDENIRISQNTEVRVDREHTNLAGALRLRKPCFPRIRRAAW